jgi:hypothetical protein
MMRQRGRGGRDCSGDDKEARDGDGMFFASAAGMERLLCLLQKRLLSLQLICETIIYLK